MSTDFTRKGNLLGFVAEMNAPTYFKILNDDCLLLSKEIEKAISNRHQEKDELLNTEHALGCYERFRGCMLNIHRLSQHEEQIKLNMPTQTGTAVFCRGAEVLIDFESTLFHGRSTLDRLAFFISKNIYGQDCDKYTKLTSVLKNFEKKDQRATDFINICNTANSIFEGILFDSNSGKKSLRSHLIHKSTASENSIAQFALHYLGPNQRIVFDAILGGYPLFKTACILGRGLTFIVLNALSIFVGSGRFLDISNCKLTWESKMVDFREYESERGQAIVFTLWSTTPSGCTLRPIKLDPSILNEAF